MDTAQAYKVNQTSRHRSWNINYGGIQFIVVGVIVRWCHVYIASMHESDLNIAIMRGNHWSVVITDTSRSDIGHHLGDRNHLFNWPYWYKPITLQVHYKGSTKLYTLFENGTYIAIDILRAISYGIFYMGCMGLLYQTRPYTMAQVKPCLIPVAALFAVPTAVVSHLRDVGYVNACDSAEIWRHSITTSHATAKAFVPWLGVSVLYVYSTVPYTNGKKVL